MILLFKPRFLMSEHERSLLDLRMSGADLYRDQLRDASQEKRDDLWTQALFNSTHLRRAYRMSSAAMLGAVFVCVVNLVVGSRTGNYWLLLAAIAVIGVLVSNLIEYKYRRDVYYGSLRLLEEFKQEPLRHDLHEPN